MPDITKKIRKQQYDWEYRRRNKVKRSEQGKEYYSTVRKEMFKNNPKKYLWSVARTRARKFNDDFTISIEDIVIPEKCPIFDVPLTVGNGYAIYSMSLDRVDNTQGYIPGNVRVISRKANLLKSYLNIALAEKLIKYMKGEI